MASLAYLGVPVRRVALLQASPVTSHYMKADAVRVSQLKSHRCCFQGNLTIPIVHN